MAVKSILLASAENGAIAVSLRYTDTNMRTQDVQYTNSTSMSARFTVQIAGDPTPTLFTVPPNVVDEIQNVPSKTIALDAKGRLIGMSFGITWPV